MSHAARLHSFWLKPSIDLHPCATCYLQVMHLVSAIQLWYWHIEIDIQFFFYCNHFCRHRCCCCCRCHRCCLLMKIESFLSLYLTLSLLMLFHPFAKMKRFYMYMWVVIPIEFACMMQCSFLMLHLSFVDDDVCLFVFTISLVLLLSCIASEMNIYSNTHGFCCHC